VAGLFSKASVVVGSISPFIFGNWFIAHCSQKSKHELSLFTHLERSSPNRRHRELLSSPV
jgi:hypothetical protein